MYNVLKHVGTSIDRINLEYSARECHFESDSWRSERSNVCMGMECMQMLFTLCI